MSMLSQPLLVFIEKYDELHSTAHKIGGTVPVIYKDKFGNWGVIVHDASQWDEVILSIDEELSVDGVSKNLPDALLRCLESAKEYAGRAGIDLGVDE